ncbi:MAG: VOC family protein [Acidimicrobiales bacterium]
MSLRWYSIVVDCHDVKAQGHWWAEALGWKPIHETDDEIVIVPQRLTVDMLGTTPWEQVPPCLVFGSVPEGKTTKNRLHIDLAPHTSDDRDAEIDRLLRLGATRVDVGQSGDESWDVFADPEGNEFCVLSSRDM